MIYVRWTRMRMRRRLRQIVGGVVGVTALSLSTALQAENLHSGLVGYWPLDEGMGDIAGDGFGSEFDDGLLRDDPNWLPPASSKFGNSALQFEGFQDVLLSDSADLNITTNAVTVSAWVNLDLLPSELPEAFGAIYDSATDNYIMYLDRGNQELRFKVTDSDGTAERPGVPESMLTLGEWNHVMGVYDGDEATAKIYFNGMPIDKHVNGSLVDSVLAGQIAGIGGNPLLDAGNPSVYFFNGAIDDVAVWNRPLGLAEASYLYNDGAGNAVGAANPNIAFVPDEPVVEPIAPTVQPVIRYDFEGTFANSGSGGAAYDATFLDEPGLNDAVFGPGSNGLGMDLRENPVSQAIGDAASVDYTLTDEGSIVFDYQPGEFYNFQSLWTNSIDANDWEMWIYQDGVVRGRVDGSAIASYDLDLLGGPGNMYQIAFTWERSEDGSTVNVKLYVDGELRQETLAGPWVDPGDTFFIGGGDGANHVGNGIWDAFSIYDVALSPGEVLYLFGNQTTLPGDFNGDGMLDAADLDQMAAGMIAGDVAYDLDGNGVVDVADRTYWVNDLKNTWMGDANLDGEFNSADFVTVFTAGKYETGELALWSEGDWDGNQKFDSGDFVAAFQNGGYENGPRAAELAAVPEPSGAILLGSALAAAVFSLRRKR